MVVSEIVDLSMWSERPHSLELFLLNTNDVCAE
jgi:hypothetical protein